MDAFVASIAWRDMVFAKTATGEIWRIWFIGGPESPLMERLTSYHAHWDEPVRLLERAARPAVSVHENNPHSGGWIKDMFVPSGRRWLSMDGEGY